MSMVLCILGTVLILVAGSMADRAGAERRKNEVGVLLWGSHSCFSGNRTPQVELYAGGDMTESERIKTLLNAPEGALDSRALLFIQLAEAEQKIKELEEKVADLERELAAALERV